MKKIVVSVLVIATAFAFALGCEKMKGVEPPEAVEVTEEMPKASVSAASVVIGDKSWTVEVATTDEERMKGLGGRESIASNTGMWFVFPAESTDPFWMKDTAFDLDMIFVGSDMKVVDVKLGNKKLTEDLIQPSTAYRYVLEIPAGGGMGIALGTIVDYRMGPQ